MKNLKITFTTILLVLGCFSLSPAVNAADGPPIVGLWDVHYTSDFGPQFEAYDQWHSDGQEFEVADLAPGVVCQGTWRQVAARSVQLFHVGFTFGGGCPGTDVRFEETQTNTVSLDRNSYDGTYDVKYYDANGNLVCEDTGTMHATRLSVNPPALADRRPTKID
jgi:hypothetical protein